PEGMLLRRVSRDHRDEPRRLGHVELDLSEQPLDLDLANDPVKAVAGTERVRVAAAQPRDLLGGNGAAIRGVALDVYPPLPIPAPKRVERDPERPRRLARAVAASHDHDPIA